MHLPQPLRHVLTPKLPWVELIGVATSAAAATTYTFTNNTGHAAGTPFAVGVENVLTDTPLLAANRKRMIVCYIGGDDSAANFSVNSATLNGVAGTELVDRGGATNRSNSAVYGWPETSLLGATTFDLAVTWSEAVTACGVAVFAVGNLRSYGAVATCSGTGTTASTPVTATLSTTSVEAGLAGGILIGGSHEFTTDATSGQKGCNANIPGTSTIFPWFNPTLAVEVTVAGGFAGYGAFFALVPNVHLLTAADSRGQLTVAWEGAAGATLFDFAAVLLE